MRFTMAKKLLAFTLAAGLVLTGCSRTANRQLDPHKINVVTSFYPLYDFTTKIGGSHVQAFNLVPAGVEPHDWTPKGRDLQLLTKSQLFVYEGAGMEGWAGDVLKTVQGGSPIIVEASKGVTLMQAAEEENTNANSGHQDNTGVDPHIWLSPQNAKIMGDNIKKALIQADPANKADYEANYAAFAAKLDTLDSKYRQALGSVKHKRLVVSHQAFAYLCRDYGLTQMPTMGLAPDAEPTAQQMKQISDFIKQNDVKTIFFEELVSDKLAKSLAQDTGATTMVLNPLEGLTEKEQTSGQDYFSVMETNLQHIVQALQ